MKLLDKWVLQVSARAESYVPVSNSAELDSVYESTTAQVMRRLSRIRLSRQAIAPTSYRRRIQTNIFSNTTARESASIDSKPFRTPPSLARITVISRQQIRSIPPPTSRMIWILLHTTCSNRLLSLTTSLPIFAWHPRWRLQDSYRDYLFLAHPSG